MIIWHALALQHALEIIKSSVKYIIFCSVENVREMNAYTDSGYDIHQKLKGLQKQLYDHFY